MPPIDTFTLITGLASLFGFIIQIFDFFPRFGKVRQIVFIFLFGVFSGSLLRAIEPSGIRLNFEFTGFGLLLFIFTLVLIALLITAAFTDDIRKRTELFTASGIGFFAFLIFAFFGAIMSGVLDNPNIEKERLTAHELNLLSNDAESLKDNERAIMYLTKIKSRLKDIDACKAVDERIKQLEINAVKQ